MRISDWSTDVCSSELISEDRLAAEGGEDLAYDTKARKDHDVNFGVTEETEQMLIKDRIATASRSIEGGAEIAICEQHGDASGQHREREQQQECRHQHGPGEQRHLVERHARRTHVQDSRDEVDCTQYGACASDMQ